MLSMSGRTRKRLVLFMVMSLIMGFLGYSSPIKADTKKTVQRPIREDRPLRFISGIYPIHDEAVGDG